MRRFRLATGCLLILAVALSFEDLTDTTLANGGGRFLLPHLPAGTTINLSDAGSSADWPANAMNITITAITVGGPSGTGKLVIKRPDDPLSQDPELYVFLDIIDSSVNNFGPNIDTVDLMFDNAHDHAVESGATFSTADDRGIRFGRDLTVRRVFGLISSPTVDTDPTPFEAARATITSGAAGWKVEAKLLPSDFGLNNFNALVGAALLVTDNPVAGAKRGHWPDTSATDPMTWANLITRLPIDHVLLVDQSGSMGGVKWDSARRAGDNFALVLSKMMDSNLNAEYGMLTPSQPGDRLGLASFTWNAGSGDTTIKAPLATVSAAPGFATNALPATPAGWTPIAWGINRTVEMFSGVVPNAVTPSSSSAATLAALNASPRTRVVMLLSDGQHNRPNATINYTVGRDDFSYVPAGCNVVDPMNTNSLVRVNTIGVGTDATVDPVTLKKIMKCFSGSAFTTPGSMDLNIYNTTGSAIGTEGQLTAQLTQYFVTTVAPYFQWNFVGTTSIQLGSPAPFTLKAGERKLLIFAFWDNKSDANDVTITVTKPDMTTATFTGTGDTTLGAAVITVNNPPAGQYANLTATTLPARTMVLLDLRTEAQFAIDNQPHGTSSTITLKGKLRDDGRPVSGADVRVDIARPQEGFGTYVSTNDPSNCQKAPPQLPPVRTVLNLVRGTFAVPTSHFMVAPVGSVSATTSGGPDVPAPAFDRIQQLFNRCGKTALNRVTDSGLKLFDDATHGDDIANDGIYTLRFENTQFEGSYVFRFRTSGTTPDSTSFSRAREIGEYVRIDVDPPSSPINFRDLQQAGTIVTREYSVTPRDIRGEYLGPNHADDIKFNTTAGAFITPVIDYNNGIYSQVLRFDRATENPVVGGTVQDEPLIPTTGFEGFEGFEFFPYIGGSFYQNSLRLDNGFVVGARFGYRFPNQLALEFESGVTFTRFNAGPNIGRDAKLVQLLGNVRYDIEQWSVGNWTPYVISGAGGVLSRGFGSNDSTFVFHGGFGSTFRLTNHVGLRADGRVFHFGNLNGAPSTTNFQLNAGVVFRF